MRASRVEQLEERTMLTSTPWGAQPDDTAEYALGDVHVNVVGFESNGTRDANTENWNDAYRNQVKAKIESGLQWWSNTLAGITDKHALNFTIDYTHLDTPIDTEYEPISRPSFDFQLWIYDFLDQVGFNNQGSFSSDIRAFNHSERVTNNANWAFTIFVVNDQNDADGRFAPGGFDRAFAFSGGRFFISPAGRPDSTFTHEAGHMFWARDEYRGGGTYNTFRGYHNNQNFNAWDNPLFLSGQLEREASIMDRGACEEGGGLLCTAFQNNTSSQSSLEMIGWRDSDADGVFDVLDVPHTLSGWGDYNSVTGTYRFMGTSSVQTTPNLNSSGLQSDITIARITHAQYRIDGGAWQTAATIDSYVADLDLLIPISAGSQIEIRTIDMTTGITSPIFMGTTSRPTSTLMPGINGYVWDDLDGDGQFENQEPGLAGWQVQLVDGNGQVVDLTKSIEPDDFTNSNTVLNTIIPEVTLSGVGSGFTDASISSVSRAPASTGSRVFAGFSASCGGFCTDWTPDSRTLRMDFTNPVSTISIDAVGQVAGDYGRLDVYDSSNNLIDRYTTQALSSGSVETMTVSRGTADIAYAIARAHSNSTIHLDNLRFGPESTVTTDAHGGYSIPYLLPGTYTVEVVGQPGYAAQDPVTGSQSVTIAEGESRADVDFAFANSGSSWQNPTNRFDVNDDGAVAPIDVLLNINELNESGARMLTAADTTPPYRDVNGDTFITSIDVLQVINFINDAIGGEGESDRGDDGGHRAPARSGGGEPAGDGEGEFVGPRVLLAIGASDNSVYAPQISQADITDVEGTVGDAEWLGTKDSSGKDLASIDMAIAQQDPAAAAELGEDLLERLACDWHDKEAPYLT